MKEFKNREDRLPHSEIFFFPWNPCWLRSFPISGSSIWRYEQKQKCCPDSRAWSYLKRPVGKISLWLAQRTPGISGGNALCNVPVVRKRVQHRTPGSCIVGAPWDFSSLGSWFSLPGTLFLQKVLRMCSYEMFVAFLLLTVIRVCCSVILQAH